VSPQDKAPAFQWYVRDFMSDEAVALMSYEQQGIYRALLDRQWLEGSIPADTEQIAALLKIPHSRFTRLWPAIAPKFVATGAGRLQNTRMERERQKQDEYRAHQSEAGKHGAAKRWSKPRHSEPKDSPLANDSSSSASSSASALASTKSVEPRAAVMPMRSPRSMGALGSSPIQHANHGRCNDRGVCMPQSLYAEILGRFGNSVSRFDEFYQGVLSQMPDDFVPTGNVFQFWHDMLARTNPGLAKASPRDAAMKAEW
jgi:uncharacterized protein YdaU (DUF1376 family)